MHHASLAKRSASLLAAVAIALTSLVAISQAASAAPKAPYSYGSLIESYARYAAQTKCSPSAKPGTSALSKMLLSTYKGSRSLGIVRACSIGGTSEHKEGRAFDWGLSAYSARDRAFAANFVDWLLATDKYGNKHANLRRLGIQYMIWNKRIWSTSYASSGWRAYSGVSPHTDHMHISLGWDGANGKTSYWTNKVAGKLTSASKPAAPKPAPAPVKLLSAPARPATLLSGPTLNNETVTLPANSTGGVTTKGALVKGQKYFVELSGTFKWAPKDAVRMADAECTIVPGSGWKRKQSLATGSTADHMDVFLNGVNLDGAADTNTGDTCDSKNHVYRTVYTADRTGRANFRIWEATTAGQADNTGSLSIRVQRYVASDDMSWSVPANKAAGVNSPGVVTAGQQYVATVIGSWKSGAYTVDAECSTGPGDSTWRRYRTVGSSGDPLDVLFDKSDISADSIVPLTASDNCDPQTHAYQFAFTANSTQTVNVRVGAVSSHAANAGALSIRLKRVVPISGAETVPVDSRKAVGRATARVYEAGKPVLLRVKGSYTLGNGYTADAECTTGRYDASWRSNRSELNVAGRTPLGEATVSGIAPTWVPVSGYGDCDSTRHEYSYRYTPNKTGLIHLGVADNNYADNSGALTITVEPTQ